MTEKRFSIKSGSSIGLSSIYTDNGKVMTQLEVLDVLNEQHETIQDMKFFITNLESQRDEFLRGARENGVAYRKYKEKVKDTLQRHYNILKDQNKVLNNDNGSIGLLEYIAEELGIDLQ